MGADDLTTTEPTTEEPTTETPTTEEPTTETPTAEEPAEEEDALITAARGWLRIGTKSRNDEIKQVMDACLIDLKNGGVVVIDTDDPAIQQAMKLFLKSQFGYDNNAERFGKAYEFMKASLALSGDYNTEAENGETD